MSYAAIAARIERAKPRIVVFCGRGSSGHVRIYLLSFRGRLDSGICCRAFRGDGLSPPPGNARCPVCRYLTVRTQPRLVNATQVARKHGALTLAIVNDADFPAAKASELVLPIAAGAEHSVAATKTVLLSMIAGAQLVAALGRDDDLGGGLRQVPKRFSRSLECDWSAWADSAARAAAAFVVGRGFGLGSCARSRSRWPKFCACRQSDIAQPNCVTGHAHRFLHRRRSCCCDRTTRLPLPSTILSRPQRSE